ncbi:MAG: chorismate synthase, partial [Dehalococcoidia bacterium]|nr:chorismate synthase [Dehalococcoidia bacterium]
MGQFRFITAGESHGRGLVAVVEGMVAGLPISEDYIAEELKRRQAGYGRSARMKIEQDKAEIISGVRHGFTMGSPISLLIWNRVWEDWQEVMSIAPIRKKIEPVTTPRPGHADLAGVTKYGVEDIRVILERASARETAARVAVGAVARRFLEEFGVSIRSHTVSIGKHRAKKLKSIDWQRVEKSPVRCADAGVEKAMMAAIDEARSEGDTLGGVFEVIAAGVPVGLGSHVQWDRRLNAQIAQAIISIPAVKGIEIGAGFSVADS